MFRFCDSMLSAHANSSAAAAAIRKKGGVIWGHDLMTSDLDGQWEAAGLLVAFLPNVLQHEDHDEGAAGLVRAAD